MMRSLYAGDKSISPSLYNGVNNPHNGYQLQNEALRYQQANANQQNKTYPYEDLYSTINKKRTAQPPAIPAKPKIVGNITHPQQPLNNAQLNYYQPGPSPVPMYPINMRPRHPPDYIEYLEAMTNRNSLPASLVPNSNYINQNQGIQGNMFPRNSYDLHNHQFYNMFQQQNGSSPVNSTNGNQYYYQHNPQVNRMNFGLSNDMNSIPTSMQNQINQMNPKLAESGLVINRGSAVNIKLPSNSHYVGHNQQPSNIDEQKHDSSIQSNASSISQMGMDMLKVIEEQKRVLLDQKNELERLDHDREYLEAKQNSEQAELINRIEKEIAQLESLWRENQMQIRKLENQDFEKELEVLKAEQIKMENELDSQQMKLARFEDDIAQCKTKIEQLESELDNDGSEVDHQDDGSTNGDAKETNRNKHVSSETTAIVHCDSNDLRSQKFGRQSNGANGTMDKRLSQSSSDEDSGGDASDDLKIGDSSGVSKLRSDVAYVDKRGLISGLRSLKLEKTRVLNRSNERINSNESPGTKITPSSPIANHLIHKDKSPDSTDGHSNKAAESVSKKNDQHEDSHAALNGLGDEGSTTASSQNKINNNNNRASNKYDLLMTL